MSMGNTFGLSTNLLHNIVGNRNESSDDEFKECSSSDSEDNSLETDSNTYTPNNVNQKSIFNTIKFSSNANLTVEDVQRIEEDLDILETISLIFLIYKTNLAHQVIHITLSTHNLSDNSENIVTKDKISNWARHQHNTKDWKQKLIEALAVVQNYKILKALGYEKEEVNQWCYPRRDTALFLDRAKKMLYLLSEKLNKEQTEKLIDLVNKDRKFADNITKDRNIMHLEYFLLFWASEKYIVIAENEELCLKNLTKHLKVIDFDKAEEIENMIKSIKSTQHREHKCMLSSDMENLNNDSNVYKIINPSTVGLCIIIDMYEFKKDKREEFKDLVHPRNLDNRAGSQHDVKELSNTFTLINFKIEKLTNTTHDCLQHDIHSIIKKHFKPHYSVLFLCILSHGTSGKIYAANCVPVTIQEIQSYVSGPSAAEIEDLLANKPKVMVVQACQGNKALYVNQASSSSTSLKSMQNPQSLQADSEELVFDGPEKFIPKHSDVLVCMSIIEGYMAVRGKNEGTKYIQQLCKCLKEYYLQDHFLDIITRVHDSLNSQECHMKAPEEYSNCSQHPNCANVYMTPIQYGTLRKKLYLVPKL